MHKKSNYPTTVSLSVEEVAKCAVGLVESITVDHYRLGKVAHRSIITDPKELVTKRCKKISFTKGYAVFRV